MKLRCSNRSMWLFGISLAAVICTLQPGFAADPLVTPLRYQIERSRPSKIDIPMRRGEYVDLQLQYLDYGDPLHLVGVDSLYFVITSGSVTNAYPARIIDALTGMVGFTITPTNLWASNSYSWELPISGLTSTTIRAFGTVTVTPSIGYQYLTNTAPNMVTCDFATLLLYNIGLSPWPNYAWVTNYVGAHGGGFVGWSDVLDKPALYSSSQIDDLVSNLNARIDLANTNPGTAGGTTNIIMQSTSVTVTNLTVQQGGTSVTYYAATDDSKWPTTQPFASGFVWTNAGENTTITNGGIITAVINTNSGSGGLASMPPTWDADEIGTNQLDIKVGGMQIVRITTNGIIITHGSLQLYEQDLWCNVRLYDGSRMAPSLTYYGHPNDWGMYARGYGGKYVSGWSVGGTEVGLLWQGGVKLMSTNYTFDGSHVGDLSGCWGYPEPVFTAWKTNMSFTRLVLSDMVVTPGSFTIKDTLNVDRVVIGSTGITVKDSGAISRAVLGTDLTIKDSLGRTISKYDAAFTYYDAFSGIAMITLGGLSYQDGFGIRWTDGLIKIDLSALNGLRFWDPYQNNLRFTVNYTGINCYNATSGTVFSVNSQTAPYITTMYSGAITNGGNFAMYTTTNAVTNTVLITGQSGNIWTKGLITTPSLIVTNNGTMSFWSSNNVNLATLGATNSALLVFGKPMLSTNYPSFILTNAFGGVTTVLWYANGIVTNKTP